MLPISTDAPLHHRPFATVGLIVANILAFFTAAGLDRDKVDPLMLSYGMGLHPWQWFSSIFLHAGFGHLVANMFYLWAFGLVIEGKLGWWRFLCVYLGLGVIECATEQVLMLHAEDGASLGTSPIIYGLLAIAAIWAPRNEFLCLFAWGWRFELKEIPIIAFAALYFVIQFGMAGLAGMTAGVLHPGVGSTAWLHLLGAPWGAVVGIVFLKLDLVDCEGWDLFSTGLRGRSGTSPAERRRRTRDRRYEAREAKVEERSASDLDQLRAAIAEGDASAALWAYDRLESKPKGWRPVEADLMGLIKLLHREGRRVESVGIMETYLARHGEAAGALRMRLKLAQILVRDQKRPVQALRVLEELPEAELPEDLRGHRRRIEADARRLRDEGVLELDGEAW